MGYRLGPKGRKGAVKEFPPELVEFMAELEKTSPYLVPYDQLSEEIKDYDRDAIRNIPALVERGGMAVYGN